MQIDGRLTIIVLTALAAGAVQADTLVMRERGRERTLEGNALGTDAAGTRLFETRDGQQLAISKDKVVRFEKSAAPVPLWNRGELKAALAEEYGSGFHVTESGTYVIVHSSSAENAKEAGRLLNKAQNVFVNYFTRNGGFKLHKSKQPLIAVVFEGRRQYIEHVSQYLGATANMTVGVYIPTVNRIYLYNAFGGETARKVGIANDLSPGFGQKFAAQILEQNISTLVHEAVHQAAYNTGFHNRKVIDYPVWLVEGMAMYFETTDVNAPNGWKGGKSINPERASRLKVMYQRGFHSGFLEELLIDDSQLRTPTTAADGYALSWGLTYFLLRHHKPEYMEYVRLINDRPEFSSYPRTARLKDFETAFKMTPIQMEAQFVPGIIKMIDK